MDNTNLVPEGYVNKEQYDYIYQMALHMLLESYIQGENPERNMRRDLQDIFGIVPSSDFSLVLIIDVLHCKLTVDGDKTLQYVEKVFRRCFDFCSLVIFFDSGLKHGCFIIPDNLQKEDATMLKKELMAEIIQRIKLACRNLESNGIFLRVSLSSLRDDLDPKQLFREALVTYDHLVDTDLIIMTPDDVPISPAEDKREMAMKERQFISRVIARDFFGAVEVMDSIMDGVFIESQSTLEHAKSNIFTRLEMVMSICGVELHPNRQVDAARDSLAYIMQARRFSELKDKVFDFFVFMDEYCGTASSEQIFDKVKEFIVEAHSDPSLGAAMICQRYKFSPSYLSRLFSVETGGIVGFIHSVRVEKAKELLETTTMNINSVAEAVGFANRWTFIRAFRSQEDMSPSEYRKYVS